MSSEGEPPDNQKKSIYYKIRNQASLEIRTFCKPPQFFTITLIWVMIFGRTGFENRDCLKLNKIAQTKKLSGFQNGNEFSACFVWRVNRHRTYFKNPPAFHKI